jgi:hypothetical protein
MPRLLGFLPRTTACTSRDARVHCPRRDAPLRLGRSPSDALSGCVPVRHAARSSATPGGAGLTEAEEPVELKVDKARESLFTLARRLRRCAARSRPLTARGWAAGGRAARGGGVEAALARLVHHGNALAHARHLKQQRLRAPLLSRVRRPPAARRVPLRQRGWPRAARAPRRLRRGGRRRRSRRAGRRRSARWLAGRVVPAHVPPRALPARHGRRRRVASGPDPRAPHEADLERRVDGATRRA